VFIAGVMVIVFLVIAIMARAPPACGSKRSRGRKKEKGSPQRTRRNSQTTRRGSLRVTRGGATTLVLPAERIKRVPAQNTTPEARGIRVDSEPK
jgi:hypothetical protein